MCRDTTTKTTQHKTMSKTSSSKSRSKPAFPGSIFDTHGHCLKHEDIQLAEQVKQDGQLLWKEIKMNCPKCCADEHKSRRVTSLGGKGVVKRGRTVHGQPNPLRSSSKSGRNMDVEFDTPFDELGRCHHHPNVQMATKKVRGGWKILIQACPKCIEANFEEHSVNEGSVGSRSSSRVRSQTRSSRSKLSDKLEKCNIHDEGSVSSRSTKRSVTSRTTAVTSSGKFDKNGCCTKHPHIQVAKKKMLGGWKELRDCPKCIDPSYNGLNDAASVGSKKSVSSKKSSRSVKSNGSRRGGKKTDRYGALPFDGEGYCHAHPGIKLAKKKALGGWKVIHDICPECANDASSNAGSARSRTSSRKSGTGRFFDPSGSETSSQKTGKSGKSGPSTGSNCSRKKKIRVKSMKYTDENGKEGRYSGDVNDDHEPHGEGKMKYKDGTVFSGVWSDGSAVHGKSSKSSGIASSGISGKDSKTKESEWARGETKLRNGKVSIVRKMKWMDYYGDPGVYSGEVDAENMPHGRGTMKYDHGLIQEGLWNKGQYVDGSEVEDNRGRKSHMGLSASQETLLKSNSSKQHAKETRQYSSRF